MRRVGERIVCPTSAPPSSSCGLLWRGDRGGIQGPDDGVTVALHRWVSRLFGDRRHTPHVTWGAPRENGCSLGFVPLIAGVSVVDFCQDWHVSWENASRLPLVGVRTIVLRRGKVACSPGFEVLSMHAFSDMFNKSLPARNKPSAAH